MALYEMEVEVACAMPDEQFLVRVTVAAGATVAQVLAASGVLQRHPQITGDALRVGVFGREVALDTPLQAGDRVEIYRVLRVDPGAARRRRAEIKKSIKSNI
jgi:putative ubiquitin-RnfH superfamily antitoxin RatB of RatAB toxin-antitoxin module